ncbi:putative membrane protein [Kaistia hirudinis]|uniref:Putative membrane protein n=1 Tax=Kaistia hirudinis TaxID=1293440 RepID=A0A840AW96_9HYPH|nr:DUF1003 domain-containing protein [Kaistia hirudinis]MBB3933061.1 putative membrane protein [Kaistia hirudinis]
MSEQAIREFATRLLAEGPQALSTRDRKLLEKIARRRTVARNINAEFEEQLTFGERVSDRVAEIGGSWAFIIGFGTLIIFWVILNSFILVRWNGSFDAYPYVFLNLILSMVAAIQAPVIMMSQNRQSDKDRLAAAHDYEVNLKAEIEIAALHEKLDQLRSGEITSILDRIETLLERHMAEDDRRESRARKVSEG